MTKLPTPLFKKVIETLKQTYYFTYLFTALSSGACINHEFTTLRNCWTFGTAFNSALTAQSTSGESVFVPAYGPKEDILSRYNMLIE